MRLGHTLLAGYALVGAIAAAGACAAGASVSGACEKITPSAATVTAQALPTATAAALFRANISGSSAATAVGEATGYNWTFVVGHNPCIGNAYVTGTWHKTAAAAAAAASTPVADAQRIRQVAGSADCVVTGDADGTTDVSQRGGIVCVSNAVGEPAVRYGGVGGLFRDGSGASVCTSLAETATQSLAYVPTAAVGYCNVEGDAQRIRQSVGSADVIATVSSSAVYHWFPVVGEVHVYVTATATNTSAYKIAGGVAGATSASAGGASSILFGIGDAPVSSSATAVGGAVRWNVAEGAVEAVAITTASGGVDAYSSGSVTATATTSGFTRINDYTLASSARTSYLSATGRVLVVPTIDRTLKVA